ncbi:MAG TPA: putative peptidoglycan glycosyltransferase FtsW [Vitreimonas sp.]|nr:putative peptidoglycan glycosyltransferase FtsW [Vitreimonas sp.]
MSVVRPMGRSAREPGGSVRAGDAAGSLRGGHVRESARPPAKARQLLRRERHQADLSILVAVVALSAIGILMVYSSTAMRAYLRQSDTLAVVGPQIQWAALGIVAMVVMMRVDYRLLRLASIPGYAIAIGLLALVLVLPEQGTFRSISVGGAARWIQLGPLPAVHPAEFAKLALIIYLAHWVAGRGVRIRSFLGGTLPFLVIVAPVAFLVFREPDLGTTIVITLTAFTMFFVAGANLAHFAALAMLALVAVVALGLRGYQVERIQAFMDPWSDPLGKGFHTVQGLLALALGGLFGAGLGGSRLAAGLSLPNASNDFIFAVVAQEFGFVGASLVVALFLLLGYAGMRTALRAPDTFGALMAAGITGWLCIQAFINIAVVVALVPVTGITLPFISDGGSSLIISFAAVGILLSISRETVERGSWNDAPADRGRGHGRTHLPGTRRRSVASRRDG